MRERTGSGLAERSKPLPISFHNEQHSVSHRPVWVTLLIGVGFICGAQLNGERVWEFISASIGFIGLWFGLRCSKWRILSSFGAAGVLSLACVATAAAYWIVRYERAPSENLSQFVDDEPRIWRLRGRVSSEPTVRRESRGSLARFSFLGPVSFFRMQVKGAVMNGGKEESIPGAVLVRTSWEERRFSVGDEIEAYGMLRAFPKPRNPGEFDRHQAAKKEGIAGILSVKARGSIRLIESNREGWTVWMWKFRTWRAKLQKHAAGWLHQDLNAESTKRTSESVGDEGEALLAALLLGDRGPSLDEVQESFRRVGLSHLLSISGLHLGILVLTGIIFVRFLNPPIVVERVFLLLLVGAFLLIVPARIPVWRAGAMLGVFGLASKSGRRISAVNVLALSAIGLMIWKPSEMFEPGFQLSFGIVFAMLALTNRTRYGLFGERQDIELLSAWGQWREWGKSFVAATLVAWVMSLPIVIYHFHTIPLIAPLATMLASPFILVILAGGYLKILTAFLYPSLGVVLGPIVLATSNSLVKMITVLDAIPGAYVSVKPVGLTWTVCASGVLFYGLYSAAVMRSRRWHAGLLWGALIVSILVIWMIAPWDGLVRGSNPKPRAAGKITMLSVGNGSCYVVESGGEVAVFDAGVGGFFGAGDAMIVPALRAMGITRVETIFISHGDIDHYLAAIEIMESFRTNRVIVPPQMVKKGEDDPRGPVAFFLEQVNDMGGAIETAARGSMMKIGELNLRWLNPIAGFDYERSNNSSFVIRVETTGNSPTSFLFTGDIQAVAMKQLERAFDEEALHAEMIELPHHGGWSDDAVHFVEVVNPKIILQSAGSDRLRNDRWSNVLGGRERWVTAVDGATTCTINADGTIDVGSFISRD